ncbi:MAG: hypothetical protein ABSH19_03290 [Opitutales bacterium]|jgi:hypothetical protein
MYINIKRIHDANVPFDVYIEAGNDWTHFTHLHRKSHLAFRLLFKSATREIFLYKSRLLYPLPFYNTFIVFREMTPATGSYRQIYHDVNSGRTHFMRGVNEQLEGGIVRGTGEYWFDVPNFWRFFPGLYFWLFKKRMRKVAKEDNVMMRERILHGVYSRPACSPPVPDTFDLLDDLTKGEYPKAMASFSDQFFEDIVKGLEPTPTKA